MLVGEDTLTTAADTRGSRGTQYLFFARYQRLRSARTSRPGKAARTAIGVFTPRGQEKAYAEILPSDFDLIPQRGDGFGERLTNAADDLLGVGFDSCCLINSDSPTVTVSAYARRRD